MPEPAEQVKVILNETRQRFYSAEGAEAMPERAKQVKVILTKRASGSLSAKSAKENL